MQPTNLFPLCEDFNLTAPALTFQCSILIAKGADRLARYAFRCPTFGILQGNVPFPLNPTPPKKETLMRKRPIEVKFRLSQEEYEILQRKLVEAGTNRNAFLVKLILGAQIYPREQLIELNLQYKIMNRLIRGAATNINQLTRIANTNNTVPAAKFLIDMYQDIRIIKDNLQPLWEETRRMAWRS